MKLFTRKTAKDVDSVSAGRQAIYRNLLIGDDGTYACFRLGEVQWDWQTTTQQNDALAHMRQRWAQLVGGHVQIRATSREVPVHLWAQGYHRRSPGAVEVREGQETMRDYLITTQEHIAKVGMRKGAAYLLPRISTRRMHPLMLKRIFDDEPGPAYLTRARANLVKYSAALARPGFLAEPVTSHELAWLMHSSVGLGLPVPPSLVDNWSEEWAPEDLAAVRDQTKVTTSVYGPTSIVRGLRGGHEYRRHVAVLTVGRMKGRETETTQFSPWMAHASTLGFDTDWTAILDVEPGERLLPRATVKRRTGEDQVKHYEQFGEKPPLRKQQQIDAAERAEHALDHADPEISAAIVGSWRVAVWANTEQDLQVLIGDMQARYRREQGITLEHTYAQQALLEEFVPGAARAINGGHVHVMPPAFVATAVPNAASGLGDDEGPYNGYTLGTKARPVMLEPTWGPRHNLSGLLIGSADLGAGKSMYIGACRIQPSVARGHRTVLFDGSGALGAAVATLSQWQRRDVRWVEMSDAARGTLNPWRLVPDPQAADHPVTEDFEAAMRAAAAERRALAVSTLLGYLPYDLVHDARYQAVAAITDAVREAGGAYGTSPWRAMRHLESTETGRFLARTLLGSLDLPGGHLAFPDEQDGDDTVDPYTEALLSVFTMRKLTAPGAGTPAEAMTPEERMSNHLMHLASRYATRTMYADREPKVMETDETGISAGGASSLRAYLLRGSLDSRKHHTGFGVWAQNPSQILSVAPEITNLAGLGMLGRATDGDVARAGLRMIGVPDDHGYEQRVLQLQPGQFILRDWKRRVGVVQIDLSHRPWLFEALNTTPADLGADQPDLDLEADGIFDLAQVSQ